MVLICGQTPAAMAANNRSSIARKGATKHCCWGECKSDSRYFEKSPPGTYFIRFPKQGRIKDTMTEWEKGQEKQKTEKCRKWVYACGRKDFTVDDVKKDTYICSIHFIGNNGPTDENPDPILATWTGDDLVRKVKKRKPPADRDIWFGPARKKQLIKPNLETDDNESNIFQKEGNNANNGNDSNEDIDLFIENCSFATLEKSTQTQLDNSLFAAKVDNLILRNELNVSSRGSTDAASSLTYKSEGCIDMSVILRSEKLSKYFIGLSPKHFWSLYDFLGPAKFNLTYWGKRKEKSTGRNCKLTIPEQLFITLLRLRRGFNIFTIAHFYNVSEYLIRTVFTTWMMFLFHHFKDLKYHMFPERQAFRKNLPKVFRCFKNIRASIDCTEFKCEMPRDYSQQGNLYSAYKGHCTMKCLIAVNPNGAACFISDLYEGSVSDVDIFQQCGIMEHINPNDSFLVDKGFTIQHLLVSKQATYSFHLS